MPADLAGEHSPGRRAQPASGEVGKFAEKIAGIDHPHAADKPGATAKQNAALRAKLTGLDVETLADLLLVAASRLGTDVEALFPQLWSQAPLADAAEKPAEEPEPFMVGNSPAMQRVYAAIRRYAATKAPVLITGESGTGKELVAQAIHERSAFRSGPFVAINCGALPPTLIASELFGHEKGAFTGAAQRRIGRLESASGGTIFLDEIGDLPLELQGHLLRFLQEHTIDRVGGTRPIEVDARVIVATNVDLAQAIGQGRFREDLFYRLNVLNLPLPPLRERGEDIELLATFFLRKFAAEHGRAITGLGEEARQMLREHRWPGNVRELIGSMRRAVVMADSAWIGPHDLGLSRTTLGRAVAASPESHSRPRDVGEAQLRAALAAHGGNVSRTARALKISRMTLYRYMRRFGLNPQSPSR
ncbi:MAG TPA: sigma-54 dependent transcriptional regulator [Stellaceae bacterium]|nr:sigma-54 dependent transcriptional regulator [Stellaceae bacterium]